MDEHFKISFQTCASRSWKFNEKINADDKKISKLLNKF